ncbi:MAG: DUF2442 domain-containing protein [Calditrichaeota bacterium]|nr:DUF2442 domain-containing protein [Calditrichota bacterium]MCB0268169.1 DUF2442 domain-containing protein [Calditrichota bacterium]MCB0286420.1 DUF2442 domain-containing protein [Calditrichota bacterium]MCB0298524.1 DUF2442 domain-containing protein [Calditrichota bacterium]MCB9067648.1 DUF2442 domain-containing protein [Calditrichia bacterium]
MSTSTIEKINGKIIDVRSDNDTLTIDLSDARTISVPLAWYPRLLNGSIEERKKWRIIGNGIGINWPDLDEDISLENIILGQPSGESQKSFKRWLVSRSKTN